MKTFSQLGLILFVTLFYADVVRSQTADPIRYSMHTNASLVSLGEEMEIVIKAERIKYPSKTVFIFKEDYSVQLKVIVPDGFVQTGGTYVPNTIITFSSSTNEVVYTLKGKFVEYTGQNQFMLLKRNQSAKEQGVYVAVARLAYSVSEPSPANQRQESTTLALNSPGYVPYMTVDQLRSNPGDLEDVVNIISTNRVWTYQYDSTSSAPDNGATVLVQNGGRRYVINTDVISPALFGAKGDGVADDTSPVNFALAFAKKTKRAVSGENKQYKITNTIKVDSVILKDGTFLLASNQANIRLSGYAPQLRDCNISSNVDPASFYNEFGGAITLHLTTGAIIQNVAVTAIVRRIAVNCISRATNTMIDGLVAKTAWGVLFNDLTTSTNRIVDGVNYDGQTIGSGLTIQNSHFYGHVDDTKSGDAIEINVPEHRFSDIQIINNRIYRTIASTATGIGIGLANVDNAVVAYNKLTDVASVAGALHCEWSTNVQFVGNTVKNSEVGGSFTTSQNVVVRDNSFDGSRQFGIKSQNRPEITKMLGLDIINNTFIRGKENDITVGNIERLTIQKNRFLGMDTTSTNPIHLNFVLYGPGNTVGARNIKILDNDFVNTTGIDSKIMVAPVDCFEWQSKGNNFSNYGNTVQSFMVLVSARGICEDFYRASTTVDQVKGAIYKVNGTPEGYITGSPNRIAEDVSGGVRYRYDATSSVWSIPGESFSNPLNLGSAYIWKGSDGQPRFKTSTGGAPTIDTSGGLIPVKVQSAPASSTSPGKPGNFYSNDSFLYIYTGNGTIHSWARVAVSSW